MAIKLSTETFRVIAAFERITKVHPKDCIITDDCIYFLVDGGKLALAIGKGGVTIKEASRMLGKPVKLFEYAEGKEALIKNLVPGAQNIEFDGNSVRLTIPQKERAAVIGKGGRNINVIREFLQRTHGVESLRLK